MKHFAVLLLLAYSPAAAQVTISNPDHLEVPEKKGEIVFRMTCEVVAEQFHTREVEAKAEFPLLLVLGIENERYTEDEEHQVYAIYLRQWNETQFAASAMRLAIQRLVPRSRRDKMVREVLRRSNQIAPVPVRSFTERQKTSSRN